jgi:hypothetical protein
VTFVLTRIFLDSAKATPQHVQLGQVNVSIHVPHPTCAREGGNALEAECLQMLRLAAVAGTQEPEYGPDSIQPVGKNPGDPAYTELTKKDLKWVTLDYTNVESQTFYLFTDAGHVGFLQLIYSNVA